MIAREELVNLWGGEPAPDELEVFQEFCKTYLVSEDAYQDHYLQWLKEDGRQMVRSLAYDDPPDCDWQCNPIGNGSENRLGGVHHITLSTENKSWAPTYASNPTRVGVIMFGRGYVLP